MADFDIVLTSAAEQELADAIEWYEQQKAGLGNRFLTAVDHALENLLQNPYLYQERRKGLRALPLSPFPYLLIYDVHLLEKRITIYVVHHTRKKPKF